MLHKSSAKFAYVFCLTLVVMFSYYISASICVVDSLNDFTRNFTTETTHAVSRHGEVAIKGIGYLQQHEQDKAGMEIFYNISIGRVLVLFQSSNEDAENKQKFGAVFQVSENAKLLPYSEFYLVTCFREHENYWKRVIAGTNKDGSSRNQGLYVPIISVPNVKQAFDFWFESLVFIFTDPLN